MRVSINSARNINQAFSQILLPAVKNGTSTTSCSFTNLNTLLLFSSWVHEKRISDLPL